MKKAIIVCGSRDWANEDHLRDTLDVVEPDLVIHGAASGADTLADHWATNRGLNVVAMPAQWKKHGKAAGVVRNNEMIKVLLALQNCGYTVSVHAFSLPQSRGTPNMKATAKAHGIEVFEHGRTE